MAGPEIKEIASLKNGDSVTAEQIFDEGEFPVFGAMAFEDRQTDLSQVMLTHHQLKNWLATS